MQNPAIISRFVLNRKQPIYRRQRGASLTGYGLIVGLIAIAAIAALQGVGTQVTTLFETVSTQMAEASGGGNGEIGETVTILGVTPPPDGDYSDFTETEMTFTVQFSGDITVSGVPQLEMLFPGGGTHFADFVSSTGSEATFIYNVQPTDGDGSPNGIEVVSPLLLNGGSITNGNGNPVDLTFTPPDTSGITVNQIF